ncbi:MAG: biotin/lipoyl-binding protein, partial [Candidatus Baltobacteraceae bacterium]
MSTISIPTTNGLGAAIGAFVRRFPRWLLIGAALLLAGAIVAAMTARSRASLQLITQPVTRETLVQSVTASGTVNPQNLISVGTQVSGTIASIPVDYNSKVKRGQVLARIDPSSLQAQLDQAQAAAAQARA